MVEFNVVFNPFAYVLFPDPLIPTINDKIGFMSSSKSKNNKMSMLLYELPIS